ncbi:hypothetical protein DAH66_12655 [Sphingomonas koreensis]|uniref:Internal virion protein B n=1 Tax=Sphingomonas koreensis TaxID=93064 RepID=A0A430G2C1_9SPHN|nr:hypothetical protein [Sphingomonas koreensis]RSY83113.1 hypothetical protein DAH66_12655 [Sphingomonas koreensis]
MCLPAAPLAIAAAALSAVGTGVSTIASMQQQTYQARVADRNARMESEAARDALERGRIEDQRYQRQLSQQMGAQNAALAANGIDVGYGNAAALRGDLARTGAEDSQTIRENAVREARGFEISAANSHAQAAGYRQARTATAITGAFEFGSSILGGVQQHRKIQWNRRNGGNPYG